MGGKKGIKPRGLKADGTGRRTARKDIRKTDYLPPQKIYNLITEQEWPYKGGKFKTKGAEYGCRRLHSRDRALMALLYLTSGRILEVLQLIKNQFRVDKEDKDFLVIIGFWVSKRMDDHVRKVPVWIEKEKRYVAVERHIPASEHPEPDIPLPRVGQLAPLTKLVEDYLEYLDQDEQLFTFGESRAWTIVNYITGKWNHWFRAQSLSFQVNLLRSTIAVAKQRGISNPSTIEHYYVSDWKQFKDEFKKG